MNWLNATNFIEQLNSINLNHTDKKIVPLTGTNNTLLVNANLLEDCGPGDYWEAYGEWLNSLPETEETPVLPDPDID